MESTAWSKSPWTGSFRNRSFQTRGLPWLPRFSDCPLRLGLSGIIFLDSGLLGLGLLDISLHRLSIFVDLLFLKSVFLASILLDSDNSELFSQESISSTFYDQLWRQHSCANKLQSQTLTREKLCAKHFCTKKARMKCWCSLLMDWGLNA